MKRIKDTWISMDDILKVTCEKECENYVQDQYALYIVIKYKFVDEPVKIEVDSYKEWEDLTEEVFGNKGKKDGEN